MAGKRLITSDSIHKIISLMKNGMTYTRACHSVGHTPTGVRYAANNLGITIPAVDIKSKRKAVLESYRTSIELGQISLCELAKEIGLAESYISRLCKELSIKPALKFGKARKSIYNTPDNFEKIFEYIKQNGGYIPEAIKALNLKCCPHKVRLYFKEKGIPIRDYRYSNMMFGFWRVLPCKVKKICKADYKVTAECTLCGDHFQVTIINLKAGHSTCCVNCSRKRRAYYAVKCADTGQTFRSVLSFAKAIGKERNYQTLRNTLLKHGTVKANNLTYLLVDKH